MAARVGLAISLSASIALAFVMRAHDPVLEAAGFLFLCFGLGQLALIALPWNRKTDIIVALGALLSVIALLRAGLIAQPALLLSVAATGLATMMAHTAGSIDRLRTLTRAYGNTSFVVIGLEEDRRRRDSQRRQAAHPGTRRGPRTSQPVEVETSRLVPQGASVS